MSIFDLRILFLARWKERKNKIRRAKMDLKLYTFGYIDTVFWPFWGEKSRILDFSKVVLELFRKCLGIVIGLKRPTFELIFSPTLYSVLPLTDPRLWGPAKP